MNSFPFRKTFLKLVINETVFSGTSVLKSTYFASGDLATEAWEEYVACLSQRILPAGGANNAKKNLSLRHSR